MKYAQPMNPPLKRLILVVCVVWFAVWAYVGWRGHTLTSDANSYVSQIPAGARVPQPILAALEAGQSLTLNAVIWGAVAPLCILMIAWAFRTRT